MEEKGGLNCAIQKDGSVLLYYLPASIEGGSIARCFIASYKQKGNTITIDGRAYSLPE